MKKISVLFSLVAFFAAFSCSQVSEKISSKSQGAVIEFETNEHDFGTIPYKGNGTYEFVFTNTGKVPLVLKNVRSSCGCTVPEWPKDPVKKGEKGRIKVSYNTRITGTFSKSISVVSNSGDTPVVLVIKGKVEPEERDITLAPAID